MAKHIQEPRVKALLRLLGLPVRPRSPDEPGARLARAVARHHGPLPDRLGRRIERLVELRHRAGRWDRNSGTVFVLPPWLAAAGLSSARPQARTLRIRIDVSRPPRVAVIGRATRRQLAPFLLATCQPTEWRRRRIVRAAASFRRDLEQVLGTQPVGSAWLTEMANSPPSAEQAAIAVWNEFLAAVYVPLGLRIPGFELSLAELLEVRDGPNGEWFANQWPAAAAAILRAGKAKEEFRRIDADRDAAIESAAAAFCCFERRDCDNAFRLAREIPRYRTDSGLSRVLAGYGRQVDVHIRGILAQANQEENGALLKRMARCSTYAREQMELAAAAAVQPAFQGGDARMAMGQLVAKTFAGSGADPSGLDPDGIAAVFFVVSADCIAAFVNERLDLVDDEIEAGIEIFADFLAGEAWRLSPEQFTSFIAGAQRHAVDHEGWKAHLSEHDPWPTPAAWREDDTPFKGAVITPRTQKVTSSSIG